MNLENIGNFIAERRIKKNLTQKELANRLNVTNKAVSKWENGQSLPDVGLFENLCLELDISLNELLSGEKGNEKEKRDEATMHFFKNFNNKKIDPVLKSIYIIKSIARLFIFLEQVSGIEPPSQPWQGRILTVVLHLHTCFACKLIISLIFLNFKCKLKKSAILSLLNLVC